MDFGIQKLLNRSHNLLLSRYIIDGGVEHTSLFVDDGQLVSFGYHEAMDGCI